MLMIIMATNRMRLIRCKVMGDSNNNNKKKNIADRRSNGREIRCYVCNVKFDHFGDSDDRWMVKYDGSKRMPLCTDCYKSCVEGMKTYLERHPDFVYAEYKGN